MLIGTATTPHSAAWFGDEDTEPHTAGKGTYPTTPLDLSEPSRLLDFWLVPVII